MKRATRKIRRAVILASFGLAAAHAWAQDANRGKTLYWNTNGAPLSCGSAGCHNGFPTARINGINKGTNPAVILNAIAANKGGMGFLSTYVNNQDAADIAAYIANPNAATGAPAITLSATALTFGTQTVGNASAPQTITVGNGGTAALTISALSITGANGADFTRSGTCAAGTSVAAGASCTVQIAFAPSAPGARSATLTITHNAAGSPSAVALSGTGQAAAAVASVMPAALTFSQTVNTTSAAQTVTVANTGGAPLAINAVTIGGAAAADYSLASGTTCAAGASVAAGASCVVRIAFTPSATGARTANLAIAHGASPTAANVALNGTGTTAPQPAASLSAASLAFGARAVGSTSPAQTVTLTNSGQATLTLGAIVLGGAGAGDFTRAGTCASGQTIAAGGSCTLQVAFAPTASGARNATLTVNSDAANGAQAIALTGTGVQVAMAVNPMAAALQATAGSRSAPVMVTVGNRGADPLAVDAIAVSGPFALESGPNACAAAPFTLAAGQSCNLYVVFEPRTTGRVSGELAINSVAGASPVRVALSAEATQSATAAAAVAPSNVGYGGCSAGAPDQVFDPLLAAMLAVSIGVVLARRRRPR